MPDLSSSVNSVLYAELVAKIAFNVRSIPHREYPFVDEDFTDLTIVVRSIDAFADCSVAGYTTEDWVISMLGENFCPVHKETVGFVVVNGAGDREVSPDTCSRTNVFEIRVWARAAETRKEMRLVGADERTTQSAFSVQRIPAENAS